MVLGAPRQFLLSACRCHLGLPGNSLPQEEQITRSFPDSFTTKVWAYRCLKMIIVTKNTLPRGAKYCWAVCQNVKQKTQVNENHLASQLLLANCRPHLSQLSLLSCPSSQPSSSIWPKQEASIISIDFTTASSSFPSASSSSSSEVSSGARLGYKSRASTCSSSPDLQIPPLPLCPPDLFPPPLLF